MQKQKKDDLLEIVIWIRRSTYNLNRLFLKRISEGEPVIGLADMEEENEAEIISDDDKPMHDNFKFKKDKEKEKL